MIDILNPLDGPGVVGSTLAGHPSGSGAQGDVISQADKGDAAEEPRWTDDVPRPVRAMYSYDVGVAGAAGADWAGSVSGAGSGRNAIADATHQMKWELNTGTASGGRASSHLVIGTAWVVLGSAPVWRYWSKFKIPILTDGTQTFGFSLGFNDSNTADDGTDGCYFRLSSADAGNLQAVTSSNSVRTVSTTGLTVAADTWYLVEIVVNANAATVDYYVWAEGTAKPNTPTVTISTNIPTGTSRGAAARANIVKTAGTTARTAQVAYQVPSLDRTGV